MSFIPPDHKLNYKSVLDYLKKYHLDPVGFTDYTGTSGSDRLYPKQNNTQIALLIQICEKVDYLGVRLKLIEDKIESRLKALENKLVFDKELEKITQQFSQIPVEKNKLVEKEKYKFPYKDEQEKIVYWSK